MDSAHWDTRRVCADKGTLSREDTNRNCNLNANQIERIELAFQKAKTIASVCWVLGLMKGKRKL